MELITVGKGDAVSLKREKQVEIMTDHSTPRGQMYVTESLYFPAVGQEET